MTRVLNKIIALVFLFAVVPSPALALQMPGSGSELAEMSGVSAKSYAVMDINSGQILIQKNVDQTISPASLTKLVTALVVLDTKPKLSRAVTMTAEDQTAGGCGQGGSCIKSAQGVKFTVDSLFHAMLMPSANNAASALARSTGFSSTEFAARMTQKARDLGATNTVFTEASGFDSANMTTAGDYIKIISAAYKNAYLKGIAQKNSYLLRSTNKPKYNQTIKNTDKLLTNPDVKILMAKTGHLDDYNFAAVLKYHNQDELAVVVLGADRQATSFNDTALLAKLAEDAKVLAISR